MTSHLLDGHNLAKLEDITRQSLGHPHVRIEKAKLLDGYLPAVHTDDLVVLQTDPDPCRTKIQVSDPSFLLAENSCCLPSADIADRTESLVGDCLQVSSLDIGGHPLSKNMDSWKGEIVCYTQ